MRLYTPARVICLGILSLALLAACGAQQPIIDPYAAQRADLQYQAQQHAAQVAQGRADTLEPLVRISLGTLLLLPVIIAGVGLDAWRLRRRLVMASSAGVLPLPRRTVEMDPRPGLASVAAFHTTELARATPARMFSPVTQPNAPALVNSDPPLETLPGLTDLSSLITDWRPSLQSILLGVGPGGARYTVHCKDLVHLAICGQTGGGKSNVMRLVLAQLVASGARVVLADPHYCPLDADSGDDWRPIEHRLHLAPAVTAGAIGDLLSWLATDELPQRMERRRAGQSAGVPIFLGADELPAIVADVKDAPDHMARILREGRKAGIFLCTASQDWLVKSVGGTGAVRDNFRTAFYTGGDATSARVLLDVSGRVDDGQLGQGLAMLRSKATPTAQLVRVPLASNEALYGLLGTNVPMIDVSPKSAIIADFKNATVADLATTGATERLPIGNQQATGSFVQLDKNMPAGSIAPAMSSVATSAPQSAKALSAEQQRILSLFAGGEDVAGIVRSVYGVSSSAGRPYQDRSREVQQALRAALGAS